MIFEKQFDTFWSQLTARKRNPPKPATLAAYRSYWKNWVNPEIGRLEVSQVENGAMKGLVSKLASVNLSPATIAGITQLVKGIVASAIDDNGNCLYVRKWNAEFIDQPVIQDQDAPVIGREALSEAISRAQGQSRTLYALLAGSGLRISEALALKVGPRPGSSYWDPDQSKLVIRKALYRGKEQSTKTAAGVREVDLAPELNTFLMQNVPQNDTFCFSNQNGTPLRLGTAYAIKDELGLPGFHSFRRFRITHLENQGVPRGLVMFWTGHAGKDVHDRYVRLDKDVEARKEWANRAGVGFSIPQ
ncbi:MAG: site-specific integrase [Thaumarchaeota archaeon]|nr:site-specific integrase [Nitrososphaerota archaeon]